MRNIGPGQWREWRWGSQVVPLYCADPKAKIPEGEKTINEVAYLTMRGLMAKNALPRLTDAVTDMVKEPDSPTTGRISEQRFRDVLKETAATVLTEEEVEAIFPTPAPPPATPAEGAAEEEKNEKPPPSGGSGKRK